MTTWLWTHTNKTGTKLELNLTSEIEVGIHWRHVSLWKIVKVRHSQIFGGGGSEESLSLSGVKLLLLVVDPERTDGWYSLLHGERSRLLLAAAGLLCSSLHSLEGRPHQTMREKLLRFYQNLLSLTGVTIQLPIFLDFWIKQNLFFLSCSWFWGGPDPRPLLRKWGPTLFFLKNIQSTD